jgi:succinate dehydrogenase / fumarate reductase, membrane anchor subunit
MSRQASGLMAWLVQRVTAVYLALFLTYLLLHFTLAPPIDHAALRDWAADPLVALGLLLLIPVLLAHAWVGIRDVLMDYVQPLGARLILMTLLALCLIASGLWAFKAIVGAGIGS